MNLIKTFKMLTILVIYLAFLAFYTALVFFDTSGVGINFAASDLCPTEDSCGSYFLGDGGEGVFFPISSPLMLGDTEKLSDSVLSDFEKVLPKEYKGISHDDGKMDSLVGPEAVLREIGSALTGASAGFSAFFFSF